MVVTGLGFQGWFTSSEPTALGVICLDSMDLIPVPVLFFATITSLFDQHPHPLLDDGILTLLFYLAGINIFYLSVSLALESSLLWEV